MTNVAFRLTVVLLLAAGLPAVPDADTVLGVVTAEGEFRLNSSAVSGNATLFDGAVIETLGTPSRLRFHDGARVELSANAKAKVHQDRLVLEAGYGDLIFPGKYQIEAGALRISPATPDASGRVARHGKETVQVAAANGTLRVYAAGGILIANVAPGVALDFEAQAAGPAPPSSFLGCLLRKEGKFILYDQTTRIIIELRGSGFEREWGNRVQVIGTTDTSARSEVAAQVVDVTSVSRFGVGGCGPVASAITAELPPPAPQPAPPAAAPSAPPPTAPTGGGMSAGTKVAVAAAIVGGAGGGVFAIMRSKERSP